MQVHISLILPRETLSTLLHLQYAIGERFNINSYNKI